MLLCFAAFGVARAQVTIGDLETAGDNSYLPMNSLYEYSYSQQLYTAEEIGTAGTINAITIWMYGAEDLYTMPFDIYMVETDKESFTSTSDWESVTSGDIVYSGSVTVHNTEAEAYTFTLATPFAYSGAGNLLIAFDNNCGQWEGGLYGKVFTATDNVTRSIYARRDSNDYDPTNMSSITANETLTQRNVIEIDITPGGGPTCDRPESLVVSDITSYGATCTWESNVGNYTFEYKKAADSDWRVVDGLTANTYTLSDLEPLTAYNTRVKAVCGAGLESGYRTANFTTKEVCPDGKICIGEGTATHTYLPTTNYYNYSLTEQIYTAEEIGQAGSIYSVDIYSVGTATRTLEFYMVSTEKETFTDGTDWIAASASDLVYNGSVTFAANSWNTIEFDNPFIYDGHSNVALIVRDMTGSYVSSINFYVFDATSQAIFFYRDGSPYDLAAPGTGTVLNVKNRVRLVVGEPPACPKPTGLSVNYTGGTEATISWTSDATAWNMKVNGTPINGTITNPYTLTGLELATTYEVEVQANCGDFTSDWASASFTTDACSPEDMCAINITLTDAYGDGGGQIQVVDALTNEVLGTYIHSSGTSSSYTLGVCNGKTINFVYASTDNWSYENGWVITDIDGEIISEHVGCTSSSACDAPTNGVIATYTVSCSACLKPTNLTVTNLMPTSATIAWEGSGDDYQMEYTIPNGSDSDNLTYSFEGDMEGWTTIDADGDGFDWTLASVLMAGYNIPSNDGEDCISSQSYDGSSGALTPDNYLVSPQVRLGGSITFYACAQDPDYAAEHFGVAVSTTGNTNASDFTMLQEWTMTAKRVAAPEYKTKKNGTNYLSKTGNRANREGTWYEYTVDLSAYMGQTGYVAIRHFNCTDMFYLNVDNITIVEGIMDDVEWIPVGTVNNPYTLDNLTPGTTYMVHVSANCDGEESNWSSPITFTTPGECDNPNTLAVNEVTASSANLSWTGYQESFNVRYRTTTSEPTDPATIILTAGDVWGDNSGYQMLLDADATAYGNIIPETGALTADGNPDSGNYGDVASTVYDEFEYKIPVNADGALATENIVINNSISITVPAGTYDWCITNPTNGDRMWIASSNGTVPGRYDDFVFEAGTTYEFTIDIYGSNDGVGLTVNRPMGDWTVVENVETPYDLTDLAPNTYYEWEVQGICPRGETEWVAGPSFTTLEGYTKSIKGYGTGEGKYYLIASPIGTVPVENVDKLLSNSFDLYYFEQANEKEWVNYNQGTDNAPGFTTLEIGKGYLYANSEDVTLTFSGSAYTDDCIIELEMADGSFSGMNLVGNPYATDAFIDRPFYRMNSTGTEIMTEESTGAIEAMEGVFVYAETNDEQMEFSKEPLTKRSMLTLNLTQGRNVIDRAIVNFGEGRQLPKFQLKETSTKVYLPVNGTDYAVACTKNQGEMPVSFKAESNGNYALSFDTENVELGYLHLIDNMTGKDVDLLSTPSYTFEAKSTDYANRFKLVFATGNADDNDFAFFSNGSFVINNEGNATLQVMDVTGRMISSENINGCANVNVNAAPGVYMIRLINGENVKVQKVVVR